MKRILLLAAAAVAVVAGVAAFLLWTNIDAATRVVIEQVGSRATGTRVTVKFASFSLRDARGRISGLVVSNPQGYQTPNAFDLGDVEITIDPLSLRRDTVVLKEVVVDNLATTYELAPKGSNIGEIRANVAKFASALSGALGASDQPRRRFIVDDLYIRGGHVAMSASLLRGRAAGRALPDIHLQALGRDNGGITSAQLAAQIVEAVTGNVLKSVAGVGVDAVNDSLHAAKDAGESVFSKARGLFHKQEGPAGP
jgi:hypothetical protein